MPRKRHISPGFFTNVELFEIERFSETPCRLAFAGLWGHADREGRFEWKPAVLKLGILPFDDGVDFAATLDALASAQFIVRYEVDGRAYGYIPAWHAHQHPHPKEAASRIPPPPRPSKRKATGEQPEGRLPSTGEQPEGKPEVQALGVSSPRSVGVPEPVAPDTTPGMPLWFAELVARLPDTGGVKWAVAEFLEAVPHGKADAWVPVLLACIEGLDLPGGRPCTPEQLATTCRDFMTKAPHEWTPKFFRTCVGALMRDQATGRRDPAGPSVDEIIAERDRDRALATELAARRESA